MSPSSPHLPRLWRWWCNKHHISCGRDGGQHGGAEAGRMVARATARWSMGCTDTDIDMCTYTSYTVVITHIVTCVYMYDIMYTWADPANWPRTLWLEIPEATAEREPCAFAGYCESVQGYIWKVFPLPTLEAAAFFMAGEGHLGRSRSRDRAPTWLWGRHGAGDVKVGNRKTDPSIQRSSDLSGLTVGWLSDWIQKLAVVAVGEHPKQTNILKTIYNYIYIYIIFSSSNPYIPHHPT